MCLRESPEGIEATCGPKRLPSGAGKLSDSLQSGTDHIVVWLLARFQVIVFPEN